MLCALKVHAGSVGGLIRDAWTANTSDLKVRDLPGPAGQVLVNAGVTETSVEANTIACPSGPCQRVHNGDLADKLDFDVGKLKAGKGKRPGAHPVELLRFGQHVAAGANAEVVVRKQLVHRRDIVIELRGAPLLFKRQDLFAGLALVMGFGRDRRQGQQHDKRGHQEKGHTGWTNGATRHRRTGC